MPFAGLGGLSGLVGIRYHPMATAQLHTPKTAVASALAELGVSNTHTSTLNASIYCFGLSPTASEQTLYELFSPFGGILSVKLMRDNTKEGNPCKGFGFVNYVQTVDAMRAVKAMNGVTYEDKKLQV